MRKLSFLLIALVTCITFTRAEIIKRVNIGNLYYNLDTENKTAEVTYKIQYVDWGITTANIPSSVPYNDENYSVTSIGYGAFGVCSDLTSVTIPNSVISIEDYAFSGCTGLTSVTIPNSVTSIGKQAFEDCTGLISVTIGNSVTSIGDETFRKCANLTSVNLPNSVTSIGDRVFYGCTGLTEPVYNAHVFAFMPTSYSGAYTIPDGIKMIARNAFYQCNDLSSVTIPNTVTSIGDYAFYYCKSLTSVTIPNSVTSIGEGAFYECRALTSITIPNNVTSIEKNAFYECVSLTSIEIPNTVTSIGDWAFYECRALTSIEIPNSVTSIGGVAFYECTGLTSVTIPGSVTSIGSQVFFGCSGLTSVTFPNSVTSIGKYVFGLTALTGPVYNAHVFAYLPTSHSGSYAIPDGIETIAGCAFSSCIGLTSVTIPNSVTSIGEAAFYQCSGLTSVTIPNSVTSIGKRAFEECTGLKSVTIPNSVKSIGYEAFAYCPSLTSLTIPSSVTFIGEDAFYEIPYISYEGTATGSPWGALTLIYIEGDWGYNDATKKSIYTYLGNDEAISVPNNVATINPHALENMSFITSVAISQTVKEIGDSAFAKCANLNEITCYSKRVPIITEHTFENVDKNKCILYVLADCRNKYIDDYYWGDFMDIRPIGAAETSVTTVSVTALKNSAVVSIPAAEGATSYVIVIENGGVKFCELTFDVNGQLQNIQFAPARNRESCESRAMTQTATGWQFTVTGLQENTTYDYTVSAKNGSDDLYSNSGTFKTQGTATSLDQITNDQSPITNKVIRDGQLIILRDGKSYNVMGGEVR